MVSPAPSWSVVDSVDKKRGAVTVVCFVIIFPNHCLPHAGLTCFLALESASEPTLVAELLNRVPCTSMPWHCFRARLLLSYVEAVLGLFPALRVDEHTARVSGVSGVTNKQEGAVDLIVGALSRNEVLQPTAWYFLRLEHGLAHSPGAGAALGFPDAPALLARWTSCCRALQSVSVWGGVKKR